MQNDIRGQVRDYYANLMNSEDLKTNACCCSTEAPPSYVRDVMPLIADEIIEKFYGCGSPIPPCLDGCTVLDLGCGTGRDVYAISKLVGPNGRVIGVDMTPSQLEIARKYQQHQAQTFGYEQSNVQFIEGYIEDLESLGIQSESVDVVVSNCVINLSPFKDQVFSEIFRVLKPGGELYFSDVFCDRRLPDSVRDDPVLRGECLGGSLYTQDLGVMLAKHGFGAYLTVAVDKVEVGNLELLTRVGFATFESRTIRAIKAQGLEPGMQNYGQTATFKGSMPQMPRYFDLDKDIRLIRGRKHAVSSNMAAMLQQSRYGAYFEVSQPETHLGEFCMPQAQDAVEMRWGKRTVDLDYLESSCKRCGIEPFDQRVDMPQVLQSYANPETLQVNVTYACNLACRHCYLECGPSNTQRMSKQTMQACLDALDAGKIAVLDVTGGSPELHPDIEWFVREGAKRSHVLLRSNLTLLNRPEYRYLVDMFVECGVELVGSLPYFSREQADAQRGTGVFDNVIQTIRMLNGKGYGMGDGLKLQLAYNVSGPFLTFAQDQMEDLFRQRLHDQQGIEFDSLYAINNFPLGRFAADLVQANLLENYLQTLSESFNAFAVGRMMCHTQVNVDYDGRLYDCEVNHVLGLPVQLDGRDATIHDMSDKPLDWRVIRTSPVCYSCSAGYGSSCGGSLA